MKKREQDGDSTPTSKRRKRELRFEFEFKGGGEEQIIDWLAEKMKKKGDKASEKVEDNGEVNDRKET